MNTKPKRSRLGEMIQLYCAAHGVSETWVASELGLTKATFNRVMRGQEVTISRLMPILSWMLGTRDDGPV